MHVTVRFFASHREATGLTSYDADVPEGARAGEVLGLLCARFPELKAATSRIAFARNREQVPQDCVLREGDELALLPPMAGG
jgi:molybdopterin converting factor subunit 1